MPKHNMAAPRKARSPGTARGLQGARQPQKHLGRTMLPTAGTSLRDVASARPPLHEVGEPEATP